MFRSFALDSLDGINELSDLTSFTEIGEEIYFAQKKAVHKDLDEYFNRDGELEARKIMDDWFPEVHADVFISHSHKDLSEVHGLAGLLKKVLGLTPFIDSAVWGYADQLLKRFDEKFCRNPGDTTYCYEKRNISTTHVHLMLNMALMNMMDKTEAVFFYNTPNSVCLKTAVERTHEATFSPWIFSEISMTRMLRPKRKAEYREKPLVGMALEKSHAALDAMPNISYPIKLSHLIKISNDDFLGWLSAALTSGRKGKLALDCLYDRAGVNE